MPADSAGTRQEPEVLVDTAGLSEAEWLAWRRKGIGGSDAAAILGISPWRTARDLYDDKLGIASAQDDTGNWVALEMGHLLEDLVARIFSQKTGYPIFQIKKMFRSPRHPCMLADVDYFVTLPDGSTAILEIKPTTMPGAIGGMGTRPLFLPTTRARAGTTWPSWTSTAYFSAACTATARTRWRSVTCTEIWPMSRK